MTAAKVLPVQASWPRNMAATTYPFLAALDVNGPTWVTLHGLTGARRGGPGGEVPDAVQELPAAVGAATPATAPAEEGPDGS